MLVEPTREKGGCLLNSVSIAADYALEQSMVSSVSILDIDADHGNGIAHRTQAIQEIR
jgi:acetoin utilization deacetylase AcuC-like enzyme